MSQPYPTTEASIDAGLVATVEHAARCHSKAESLRRQAKEAMAVAASMAGSASPDAVRAALAAARSGDVPGRRPLLDEVKRRAEIGGCAPGTSRVRQRGSGDPITWPPRGIHVVYVLWGIDGVLYVGQSSNVRQRMTAHRKKPWTEAHLHFCADATSALQLEADLIYQHQPPLNATGRHRRLHIA